MDHQQKDETAVAYLATAMNTKLARARAKGRSGWDSPECTQQHLSNLLREHVEKGDPVDVANFCAFLAARGEGIAPRNCLGTIPAAAPQAPAAPAVDALDASRWRAFIASDRISFFGWAGADSEGRKEEKNIYDEPNGNYVHFGAEFWSEHAARTEDPETAARLLTTYADACIAAQAKEGGEACA